MTMNLIYKSIIDTILKNIDIGIHVVDSSGNPIYNDYDWPGNVRELENTIESAINMINRGHVIKPELISREMHNFCKHRDYNVKSLGINY